MSLRRAFCFALALLVLPTGCGDMSGRLEWAPERSASPCDERLGPDGPGSWEAISFAFESGDPQSLDALRERAGIVIQTPATSLAGADGRCEVFGKVHQIPSGWRAYALLEGPHGFFLQWPPVRVNSARGVFAHRNIRIGDEITELHIALATPDGAELLDRRAERSDWSAMPFLPEGVVICDTIALD